jgi:hypothetical protein
MLGDYDPGTEGMGGMGETADIPVQQTKMEGEEENAITPGAFWC